MRDGTLLGRPVSTEDVEARRRLASAAAVVDEPAAWILNILLADASLGTVSDAGQGRMDLARLASEPMRYPVTVLVAATAIVLASCGALDPANPAPSTDDGTPRSTPPGEAARLVRALDGDSIQAEVDGQVVEVRLLGINAPEADECHGDTARDTLIELIETKDLVLVEGDQDEDQFGRLLRSVWVGGVDVNARMLVLGEAIALQTGHDRETEYVAAAIEAMGAERGMWAMDACGPSDGYTLEVAVPEYDPPGRDDENAIQEWVDIRNVGDEDADLSGWILRDESSQHRYQFGNLVLPAGERVRVRSGCGDDRTLDLAWCAGGAVWNNGGDTAIVQDEHGNVAGWSTYPGDY